jgi:hypothetical protein
MTRGRKPSPPPLDTPACPRCAARSRKGGHRADGVPMFRCVAPGCRYQFAEHTAQGEDWRTTRHRPFWEPTPAVAGYPPGTRTERRLIDGVVRTVHVIPCIRPEWADEQFYRIARRKGSR